MQFGIRVEQSLVAYGHLLARAHQRQRLEKAASFARAMRDLRGVAFPRTLPPLSGQLDRRSACRARSRMIAAFNWAPMMKMQAET